jgi:hypothetical protein
LTAWSWFRRPCESMVQRLLGRQWWCFLNVTYLVGCVLSASIQLVLPAESLVCIFVSRQMMVVLASFPSWRHRLVWHSLPSCIVAGCVSIGDVLGFVVSLCPAGFRRHRLCCWSLVFSCSILFVRVGHYSSSLCCCFPCNFAPWGLS